MIAVRTFDPDHSPLAGLMLLEASAGTGKTYALERMVCRLIGRDEAPLKIGEILVVTFTNRAAREMKERIRKLLTIRAADTHRSRAERERYRDALSGFDAAPIHTIHGFCKMVLSSWPFETASPFRQEMIPGGRLESAELRSWIAGLNSREVDTDLMRSAYRQAGGMERLIGEIAVELTGDGHPPGAEILPTMAESEEFAALMSSSLQDGSPLEIAVRGLFSRDWSDSAVRELIREAFDRKKTSGSIEKIRRHMEGCRDVRGIPDLSEAMFGDPSGSGGTDHFLELFAAALTLGYSGERSGGLSGECGDLTQAMTALYREMELCIDFVLYGEKPLSSLVKPYMRCAFSDIARKSVETRLEELKDRSGSWGYADLIRRVSKSVARPGSPLLPVLRKRFRAALIDEFQDTDPRQWEMFRSVFTETGEPHILALIGDPKQSIYGFRGTGLQAYNGARRLVEDHSRYRLDTNYRSTPALVAATNRLFAPLFTTGADGNPPVGFEAVEAGRTEIISGDPVAPGPAVTFLEVESRDDASDAIVAEIRNLLEPRNGRPGTRASDIAVLVRGETEENEIFNRLVSLGIPAIRFRTRSVFRSPQVSALDGLLRAMDKPRDISLWKAVLLGRYFRISPYCLVQFEEEGRLDGFVEEGLEWQRLFTAGRSVEAFDAFFHYSTRTSRWAEASGEITLAAHLRKPWPRRVLAEPDGLRLWQDWRHLGELIQNRQAAGITDIPGIRTWLAESAADPDPETAEDAVRLETEDAAVRVMTMHSAKGLEFPLVFLHGGYRGKSSRKSGGEHRFDLDGTLVVDRLGRESTRHRHLAYEWEEDKRLWYVAFTRASERVWMPLAGEGPLTQGESLLYQALVPHGSPPPPRPSEKPPDAGTLRLPPHQLPGPGNAGAVREEIRSGIAELVEAYPDQFARIGGARNSLPPLVPAAIPDPVPAKLPSDRLSLRDPFTGSYTSLIRSADGENPGSSREADDRDLDGNSDPAAGMADSNQDTGGEPLPLTGDRGALFGTLVHAIFEESEFPKAAAFSTSDWMNDPEIEEIFSSLARRYYPPDWYRSRAGALKSMVLSTLRSPVDGLGRLCDIPPDRMRSEVEFLVSVPGDGMIETGDLKISSRRGFLKGFIDLLVEHRGRWWVVDWKTNVPPGRETVEAYDQSTLGDIMESHYYHLQYELYLLSLCRTLWSGTGEPVDWEKCIGGAAYLFVRGTRESDNRGVFTAKPSRDRMLVLARATGLDGVIR